MNHVKIPMVGFCAWSGTGKTTLLTRLIPLLVARGLRVGVVKHAHHSFDIDYPGKDSYELRAAGASQMLIASRKRTALITELEDRQGEPSLADALSQLNMQEIDLILVEGFKHEQYRKIELHRPALNKPLLFPDDPNIVAVASDAVIAGNHTIPALDLNNPEQIMQFISDHILPAPAALTASGHGSS